MFRNPAWLGRLVIVSSVFGVACDALRASPRPPYPVAIRVESDPGRPVQNAQILHNARAIASTGANGIAELQLQGTEGEAVSFDVRCPGELFSPSKPVMVTLLRVAKAGSRPEYLANCPPRSRTAVVAVRVFNDLQQPIANLPVMFLNKPVAQTDSSGAAHVLLSIRPSEPFQLQLDTSGHSKLRPQNPTVTFTVHSKDEVLAFEQKFLEVRPPVVRYARAGPTQLR